MEASADGEVGVNVGRRLWFCFLASGCDRTSSISHKLVTLAWLLACVVCDVIQTGYAEKGVSVDSLWKVTALHTSRQTRCRVRSAHCVRTVLRTARRATHCVHCVRTLRRVHPAHHAHSHTSCTTHSRTLCIRVWRRPTAQAAGASKVGVVWTLDGSDAHENQHKQITSMSCRCRCGRSHCP